MIEINIMKLIPEAIIPSYAKEGDAGMDLTATSKFIDDYGCITYGTGIAVAIPEGYVGLLFPRSSVSKNAQSLSNSVGVIDSGYRGEILFKFRPTLRYNTSDMSNMTILSEYKIGERIGQLIVLPYPKVVFKEVSHLSESDRGDGGFGSTGH